MASKTLSKEDQDFLAQCEEEFKDRFTEKDEDFMKVFNTEPSKPPIIENWWRPINSGRRNDRHSNDRHSNRGFAPYDRHGNRDRGYQNRRDNYESRGYNDYQGFDDNRRNRRY